MKIQHILYTVLSFFLVSVNSYAKSGKFDFHTGWSFKPDIVQISENHMIGSGKVAWQDPAPGALVQTGTICKVGLK